MKKQLSILAGSVLLASSAQAAITASVITPNGGANDSTGSSVVAVVSSAAGSFVFDAGISADDLASGTGFSIDVSSALADLGTIDSFAVFGITSGTGIFDYGVYDYVDAGTGVVYAGSAAGNITPNGASLRTLYNTLNTYISNVTAGGFFADGLVGDLDEEPNILGTYLVQAGSAASVFFQSAPNGLSSPSEQVGVEITAPAGAGGVLFDGTTLSATAVVPVPAAAWLFGSALVGMGVVRRKK